MKFITKIHGKTYDLTNFNHPGGEIPLYLVDKQDGTALFESYHPVSDRSMINKILSKYEIEDDNSIPEKQIYDFTKFNENPFVKEVREKVYDYFKNLANENNCTMIEATKMLKWKVSENYILFSLLFFSMYQLYNGSLFALFLAPFFHFLFMVNNWHDAGHFALLVNKKIEYLIMPFLLALHPPYSWYNGHTRNHHCYTNVIGLDQDLDEYITSPKNDNTSQKSLINNFLDIFQIPKIILIKLLFSNNENDILNIDTKQKYILQLLIHVLLKISFFVGILSLQPCNYYSVFFRIIKMIVYYIVQLILFAICTKINHVHEENFTQHTNFYIHQILTSSNTCSSSHLTRILTGGLNCQIEHHLFPSINSCHLPELAKIIRPICEKHNIQYNESRSIYEAFSDTIKTIKKINPLSASKYNLKKII